MNIPNIFIFLLDLFNPNSIYAQLDGASKIYLHTIAPAIIILSIAVRYIELMHENLGQGANLADAVKDVKTAIILTGLYAALGAMAIKFHQSFCNLMYQHGSIETILGHYQEFLNEINQADGYYDKVIQKINVFSIQSVVGQALCFLSMLLLALVNVLLRIIYALGFCLLYLWGMVAIPSHASKMLRISSGWFRGVMTLAIWPIVEATIYMLIDPMFSALGHKN